MLDQAINGDEDNKVTEETIVLIQDEKDNVFGAFTNEQWKQTNHFYGTGQCFLFSFNMGQQKAELDEDLQEEVQDLNQ